MSKPILLTELNSLSHHSGLELRTHFSDLFKLKTADIAPRDGQR